MHFPCISVLELTDCFVIWVYSVHAWSVWGSVVPRECAALVLELKNRPSPRSPSLTSPVAVMKTLAGFISGTHTQTFTEEQNKWGHINEIMMCVCIRKKVSEFTSMHDSAWVHVFQRATQLHKILPYRSFRNQPLLLLKILNTCQGYYHSLKRITKP